ncbi:MAG: SPOR domain-containing protein [Gammaproteobacteria bacterium]|nr:SPOR domain-containing protein [Gammaproteobacteria bacterium]
MLSELSTRLIASLFCLSVTLCGVAPRPAIANAAPKASFESALSAYRNGHYQQAFEVFRDHASYGSARAATIVGVMYAWGEGVRQDQEAAAQWYEQGARRGDAVAQYYLGNALADGVGVAANAGLARMWLTRSANQGHERARQRLTAIELGAKTPAPLADRPAALLASLKLNYVEGDEQSRLRILSPSRPIQPAPLPTAPTLDSPARQTAADPTGRSLDSPTGRTLDPPTGRTLDSARPAQPPTGTGSPPPPVAGGNTNERSHTVQLAASRNREALEARWQEIKALAPQLFANLSPQYSVTTGAQPWHRLRLGQLSSAQSARELCRKIVSQTGLKGCWPARLDAN